MHGPGAIVTCVHRVESRVERHGHVVRQEFRVDGSANHCGGRVSGVVMDGNGFGYRIVIVHGGEVCAGSEGPIINEVEFT